MGTINKLTKLVLSFLLVITCINFSIVQAEDGSDENYSEPTAVETISEEPASEPEQEVIPEEPVAEEPVIEEAAPVEEEKQEEVTPEVIEEAKVEEENNTPEIEAEPATQEETVEPEVQQEAPVEPEVQKVETVEEVKVTVVVSYVDENDHPLTDPITGSYPIEYRLDENVDAFKSFDGYDFEKVIVNDDAKNTISKDDVQKNGLRITKDMTSLKLVYQKMNLEFNESKEVIPEVTEETAEEAEPESNTNETELSAFDQTAFAGKVGVHAYAAEGVLPKGARLIVEQVNRKAILNAVENTVSDNNKEMDSAVALDISIVDKDGNEIQPNGIVNITFVNTGVSGDEVKIYHVEDDASAVTEIANNTDSFDASHFSIYVITGENEVPLTTFNFVVNDTTVSTQIVKSGDTLIAPTAPDAIGQAFVGWVDEAGNPFTGFGKQAEITETTTRTITARYEAALYVYFLNPDGTQIMRTEKVGDHDPHGYTDVSYEVDSTHKLVGWAAKKNGTENIADKISVPDGSTSVNVYAIIKEGYWVSFNSDGESIVDSQFVLHGDKLVLGKDTTPTKPGYSFGGWYNGLTKVENGATVTSPMNLTAHWKAAEVSYTINYWQQKVTDDKDATDVQKTYEYVEAETKKATTGTKISATNSKTYKGFKYNANNSSKNVEISGDGTTIINVYYDRELCTVNFYAYESTGWFGGGSWNIIKTVTGLYGANLPEGAWDTSNNLWFTSYYGSQASGSNAVLLTSFDFETAGYAKNAGNPKPSNGVVTTCNFYAGSGLNGTIKYYNEQADGTFKLVQTVRTNGNSLTVHEKYEGYELYKYSTGSKAQETAQYWKDQSSVKDSDEIYGDIINIASKLKTYSLSYYNYNSVTKTEKNIKYTAPLKSYANYTPARPSGLPEYYVFGGWYKDKACTTKFDFNTEKMPNANVQIYAKWTAKKINLTYNLNTPDGTSKKVNGDVAAGTIASDVLPSIPTVDEYSFAGWYVADENDHMTTVAFNANAAILKDTNVIGKWLYNGKLTVKYVADGVKAPEDNNVYAGGAKATVANGVKKEGKKFLGWQLDGGNVYQPGQNFEVNKDLADDKNVITLTAVFGDSETSAILTYHPGNGNGKDQSDAILNNGVVTLKNTSDLSYTAPGEDYYFAGWATSMGDAQKGNATYAAGQSVHVDVDGENVLYATWIEKTVITLVANSNTVTYNGQSQEVNGFQSLTIDGYIVSGLNAHAQGTNVGTYPTEITGTAHVEKDNEDVTNKVVVKTTPGQLTITKKSIVPDDSNGIVVDAPKGSKYDGEKHENEPVVTDTKTNKTLVKGTDYTLTYSEDVINVGTVTVTITGTGNYEGTVDTSYEITPRKVIMTSADGSKVYDGSALTKNKVTESEDGFVKDDGATYNVTGSQTEKGTSKNTFTYELKSNTKASNYTIEVVYGDLTVTAEDGEVVVVITGSKDTFEYDGTEKSVKGYDVSIAEGSTYLESDFTFSGNDEVKGTEAGTYDMGLKPEDFTNNNENYGNVTFRVLDGQLTIAPKSITPDGPDTPEEKKTGIEATDPADSIYDGKAHVNPFTVRDTKTGKDLVENKDYTLTYVGDVVNVGTVKVKVKGIGNYTGEFTKTYKITPREYTVTTDSAEKPYDGTALTAGGKIEGIVDGEVVVVHTTGSQTDVGSTSNTYELEWKKASSKNYKLKEDSIGTLTVTEQTIDPGEDPEKPNPNYDGVAVNNPRIEVYDGKEHKWSPTVADKEENALVEGTDYEVAYSTEDFTNVTGTITVTITGIRNYTGTVTRTYEITPKAYTVTTESANKVYDGTELTAGGKIEGIVDGEDVEFKVTGSQTNKGTSKNTYSLKWNGSAIETNYALASESIGDLTVTEQTIDPGEDPEKPNSNYDGVTVNNPSNEVYDGKEHKWSPTVADKEENALVEGTDYEVAYSTEDFTNVTGTITVTITGIGNYTGTVVRTYAITPAEVTVTANNANKVYGENDPELKATVTGTLNNDTVDYTLTRDPGEDVGTYAIHVTGYEDQGNYHVTYTAGEFEITKSGELILTAELTGESATKVYDGNPLTGGATANVKEGTTITYSTDSGATWTTEVPSITNVGTLNITARAENPNYEPAETTYSLTVTHATATVTAENKTKVYGTADPELTATVSGTLGNDTVAYTLAREAGENAGKYKITVTGEENQGNYKVTYTPGTFEITPKSIIPDEPKTPEEKKTGIEVTEPEGSKYDGEEHKNAPTVTDTKTGKTLTEGTDYTLSYSDDVTNAGTVTITVTGIGNYTGEFDVTYEITKRDVVLTSATDSKPYDGTALRNENVEVTGDGFAEGEGATFAVIGTITNVGTKANTFGYALNKNTLASNYNISTELGTLTITPKSIIPDGPETPDDKKTGITVENPGDVKYDGKDHAEKPVVKDEKTGVTLEEGKDYEIVYPEDIKNAGEITATVVGKGNYEGSFEINYNITKRDVTFTSATDSKQYDGNALTNGNVEITGDGFIEGEGAEYKVTGTQTQVGNSANEFEYTLNENTLASNYDITKVVGTLTVTAAPAPETPEQPKPEVKKSVDTSDDNNTVFYGNAFFMAMITLAGIIVLRKKSS